AGSGSGGCGGRGTGGGGGGGAGSTTPEPKAVPTATPAGGSAGASASASISGAIKAVNVVNGTVTIAVQGGADVVLNATSSSKLSLPLARLTAQVGSQVRVSYDAKTMAIISLSVAVEG
ncbi:MAG: hypothetical protein HY681_15480, partial [Chloroflexi bacterium]|nr:hypothetical protein [Chloroflexota bacterium]